MHFHLVPKYEDDPFEWGDVFAMNPDRKYLTDAAYDEMIEKNELTQRRKVAKK